MALEWLSDVSEADAAYQREHLDSRTLAWDANRLPDLAKALDPLFDIWRDAVKGDGAILIKTSTAGRRSLTHEPGGDLVELAMSALRARFPARPLILADGTAYGDSYREIAQRAGWAASARRYGVTIEDLNRAQATVVSEWPIANTFVEAAGILNLTKAKTHRKFGASLALKSLLGVLVGETTGYPKLIGRHEHVARLMRLLEDRSPPALSIIDGRNGIQGEGPLAGHPTRSHFLVAGLGYFGPDIQASVEMGFDPLLVPALLRPLPRRDVPIAPAPWSSFRVTACDFLPSATCAWLHCSLVRTGARDRTYAALLEGAKTAWTNG